MSLTRLARLTAVVLLVIVGCGVAAVAFYSTRAPATRVTAAAQGTDTPTDPPPQAANEADELTRTRFETLAGQLTIFQTVDFAYGRPAHSHDLLNQLAPEQLESWAKVSAAIGANHDASADLVALLKHKDPKVRTLAIAALYERQDPKQLPHLAAMIGDNANTAPELKVYRAISALSKDEKLLPQDSHEQTVGRVAQVFVDRWLEPAGYRAKDFDAYWAARKDRAFCASWFMARVNRAGQGSSGFDKNLAQTRMRALRTEVDALPAPDRDWMLLWLGAYSASNAELSRYFAEPQELLAIGKRLGPDRLMDLIHGKRIGDGPDLVSGRYRGFDIHWVLQHASALLRPTDAPALFGDEETLDKRDPWCVLAAAELQPEEASPWLHAAIDRFAGEPRDSYRASARAELAAGLWRIVGKSESDYLVDWFFGEQADKNPYGPQTGAFLDKVKGVRASTDRRLVALLITDARLDKLDYQSLECLIRMVNGWVKEPVVNYGGGRTAWQRGGWGPETPHDFAVMASWRVKLRGSVKDWAPATK